MKIYGAEVTGSLSVSGSAEIQQNVLVSGSLTVIGGINATISGTITNAQTAETAPNYTLTNSFNNFTSSYNTGSFSGSFTGNGSGLYNIPASGVTGLNLDRISNGSATASISQADGFKVNTNTEITGSVTVTGSITLNGQPIGTGKLDETTFNTYTSSNNTTNTTQNSRLNSIESVTGSISSLNTYTGSNDTTNTTQNNRLTSLETASGSIRTDFNTFSSSLAAGIELTGSNVTVKGDLLIKGTTTTINSTTVDIGDNIIQLNGTGVSNAGLVVRDATAPTTVSGSLLWDSTNDRWIAGALGSEETIVLNSQLNSFTSSTNTRLSSLETASGSIRSDFNTYTGSNNTTNTTQNSRLTSIEGVTGSISSLNTYTGSNNTVIGTLQVATSSLNTFTNSINTTIKTRLNAEGVFSGSAQVSFGTITGVPSGLVSGSSQISLASTTGFGTYINQALLTSSSPTFSTVTATTFSGTISGTNVSGNISGNAGNITQYAINQNLSTVSGPTFAGVKGSSYFDAQASSGFRIRNSADTANVGGWTRRGLWEGNSNYDPALWTETGYGLYIYTNGSATIRAYWDTSGHLIPGVNGTYNLGSSGARWNTVFTSDLSLSNGIGDYTIVEGENDLFLYNNKQNKVYKFMLQEVDPSQATPKRPE